MNDDARDNTINWSVSLNNQSTPDAAIFPAPLPPQLLAPALAGSLLQSDNNDEDIKEDEDFNRERDYYTYLFEGESLRDELGLVYRKQYHA